MGSAFLLGLLVGSALVLGSGIAPGTAVRRSALGIIVAFGSGVLISAVVYELVDKATAIAGGNAPAALGLFTGAFTFLIGSIGIDRLGGGDRKAVSPKKSGSSGLAITLGVILDSVPESAVLGLTLLGGSAIVAIVVAIFLSNVPEAMAASTGLRDSGWPVPKVLGLWAVVALFTGLASFVGYAVFGSVSGWGVAFVLSFAAGAVLTMLADTMMPEAFKYGGR